MSKVKRKKRISKREKRTKERIEKKNNTHQTDKLALFRYVLEEYPSQLIKHKYWQPDKPLKNNSIGEELKLLRWRKIDIDITIYFYIALILFSGWQSFHYVSNVYKLYIPYKELFNNNPNQSALTDLQLIFNYFIGKYLPIAITKLIGTFIAFSSLFVWIKQLNNDVEFYGLALGNYSKNMPLYETIQSIHKFLNKNSSESSQNITCAEVIIADWLKNRPSLTYWVCLSLSLMWLHELFPFIGFVWCFVLEFFIRSVLFVLSIPITSHKFATKVREKDKDKEEQQGIKYANLFAIFCFVIIFLIPQCITYLNYATWIIFILILLYAALILGILLWFALRNNKDTKKNDDQLIKTLINEIQGKKVQEEILKKEILENYKMLTGHGQTRLLRRMLADSSLIEQSLDAELDLKEFIKRSNNNESLELAQEVYSISRQLLGK